MTPAEAGALINAGGVLALATIIWLTLRGHLSRMEKREQRHADAMLAFVEVLSRIEVRIEGVPSDAARVATPPRGISVSLRQRKQPDTDPEGGG